MTTDEFLAGGRDKGNKAGQAEKLILDLLSDGKHICVAEMDAKAKALGISGRTMRAARASMQGQLVEEYDADHHKRIYLK